MEQIIVNSTNKEQIYKELLPQIEAVLSAEDDVIANMANLSAILKQAFNFWWVGFYIVKNKELVLGPFQGPLACTRIKFGRGVCGSAWERAQTIVVPNVDEFEGHIACSSLSKSEIVVPIFKKDNSKEVFAVLDIDSEFLNTFDSIDKKYLEQIFDKIKFGG